MTREQSDEPQPAMIDLSAEALAHLGDGHIAYVKQIRCEDVPGAVSAGHAEDSRRDRCCSRCTAPTARRSC